MIDQQTLNSKLLSMKRCQIQASLRSLLILLLISFAFQSHAQGFLHVDGKQIVDGNGENYILRGIGTGNWMLQEGYMMKTADVAGTQHELQAKLTATIGAERTKEFYDVWLANHFRKIDVDSMAAWGFNSVRVAMHYKWFTLPIEEEATIGGNTWLPKGFEMLDNLLSWCDANHMYLILDLHGTLGGQGKDANISDYDASKPSLWESDLNKAKTVALWRKLAERYKDEPWIGGYDLINETNWSFPEKNNSQLRKLFIRITDTIRAVDKHHIVFIEGNGFANDFADLAPAWDDNLVYSFHKYWSYNDANALKWIADFRETNKRPIWLGEAGENSNTWFTNLVALAEKNNIGWSWWPVKKSGINNVLKVKTNPDYTKLVEMWKGNGSMSADEAYHAVMTFADNHRFENCIISRDVIDALIRQPHDKETKPFKVHTTNQKIFAVDYDLGRNKEAYFDTDTANYHLNTGSFTAWNTGWEYRNDGVDIEKCSDTDSSNGYDVGWVNSGEWLQYTISSETNAAYQIQLRTASEQNASIHIEVNGKIASKAIALPATGAWTTWKTTTVNDIIIPQGQVKIKIVFESGQLNLNYFSIINPSSFAEMPFELLNATTPEIDNEIYLNLNKAISSSLEDINQNAFELMVNGSPVPISSLLIPEDDKQQVRLLVDKDLFATDKIKISYQGTSVKNGDQNLSAFTSFVVDNNFYSLVKLPGKIEAENFMINKGFELEDCTDEGGGKNTAYANNGDYLDYLIYVPEAGTYTINFRVATAKNGELNIMNSKDDQIISNTSVVFNYTGGWQVWQTKSTTIELPSGKVVLRLYSKSGEYNLNWISFDNPNITGIENIKSESNLKIYPNPASEIVKIDFTSFSSRRISLFDMRGNRLVSFFSSAEHVSVNVEKYPAGTYLLNVFGKKMNETKKILIIN